MKIKHVPYKKKKPGLPGVILFALLSVLFCIWGLFIIRNLGPESRLLWLPFLGILLSLAPGIGLMAKYGRTHGCP